MDVLFVGAGPAGLAGAIELARLVRRTRSRAGACRPQHWRARKGWWPGRAQSLRCRGQPARLSRAVPGAIRQRFPVPGPVTAESVYLLTAAEAIRIPTPPTMHNTGSSLRRCVRSSAGSGEGEEWGSISSPASPPRPCWSMTRRSRRPHHAFRTRPRRRAGKFAIRNPPT